MDINYGEILNQMSENEFSERLLLEYFDGVVFIAPEKDKVFQLTEHLSGKLKDYIDFENQSYSENMERVVESVIAPKSREILKKALSIDVIRERLKSEKTYNVDFYMRRKKNDAVLYKRMCYRYFSKNRDIIILMCEDISDIILSDIDPLTGLCDSTGFHKKVKKWINDNPGRKYRIQRYDIDHFKDINGIYGYGMGNQLLRDCGQHMKKHDTADSFSAHLNADHFARFCSDDSLSAQEYYDGFIEAFAEYELEMPIVIHMGVYDLCESNCDSYTMSYKALLALQKTKGKFNKPIAYYEKDMMRVEIEQQEFLNELDRAIKNEELEVWFQPQINYTTMELMGAEALIRWRHPEKGLIPPGAFLPVLESSGRICDVDKYMINKTCGYMRKWEKMMPDKPIIVSVNLSRIDVQRDNFARDLKAIIAGNGVPLSDMWLEITESAYMDNPEMLISVVNELRKMGFIIGMDDFGSGYYSLNMLKEMDIDIMKLDMKFLSGKHDTERSRVIISSVINMAAALNLRVIAEGVETKEQAEMLKGFGCDYMQGYYFGRPVPAEEYEAMLKALKPTKG